jgi:hypothetical protein
MPFVMLLWANLHPGFILSYGMFAIYIVVEVSKYILKKDALAGASLRKFIILISASILVSLINPNHVVAVTAAFGTIRNPYNKTILENYSLWKYTSVTGKTYLLYGFMVAGIVTSAFMAFFYRTVKLSHVMLYGSFAIAALSSFRFYIFFMLMSLAISGEYIAMKTSSFIRPLRPVAAVLTLIMVVFIFNSSFKDGNILSRPPLYHGNLPVKATEFLASRELPAPLFNPYIWGGYLIWRLYPQYRVFADSRMIDFAAYGEYREVMTGNIDILDKYGVNTVMIYSASPVFKKVHKTLLLSLVQDSDWQLVYFDGKSVIFVRTGTAPSVPVKEKRYLMELLASSKIL